MKYQPPVGSTDPNAPYVDRNTPGAVRGSAVPAKAIEDPQREIQDLISKAGMTPTEAVLQLALALQTGRISYAAAAGTANALTATLSPAPTSYASIVGAPIRIKIASTNTGAATINLNGLGAKAIVTPNGAALQAGDLPQDAIVVLVYDGTSFQVVSSNGGHNGVQWRGAVAITATGPFDPATYGLTSRDKILVLLWGAGGGAASNVAGAGGGGGGGGFAMKVIDAQSATVTIGAGGAANIAAGNSTAGGTTSFGSVFSATGGGGSSGGSGTGGGGVGGDVNIPGANGDDLLGSGHNSAKGGAAPFMGTINPINGTVNAYGGGGSTVYQSSPALNVATAGGQGLAIIIY